MFVGALPGTTVSSVWRQLVKACCFQPVTLTDEHLSSKGYQWAGYKRHVRCGFAFSHFSCSNEKRGRRHPQHLSLRSVELCPHTPHTLFDPADGCCKKSSALSLKPMRSLRRKSERKLESEYDKLGLLMPALPLPPPP